MSRSNSGGSSAGSHAARGGDLLVARGQHLAQPVERECHVPEVGGALPRQDRTPGDLETGHDDGPVIGGHDGHVNRAKIVPLVLERLGELRGQGLAGHRHGVADRQAALACEQVVDNDLVRRQWCAPRHHRGRDCSTAGVERPRPHPNAALWFEQFAGGRVDGPRRHLFDSWGPPQLSHIAWHLAREFGAEVDYGIPVPAHQRRIVVKPIETGQVRDAGDARHAGDRQREQARPRIGVPRPSGLPTAASDAGPYGRAKVS